MFDIFNGTFLPLLCNYIISLDSLIK